MSDAWTLSDTTALVTGGTQGIGRAIVEELLDLGASVLVAARTASDVEAQTSMWTAEGYDARGVAADVATPEGRAAVLDAVQAEFGGRLDTLVNNVGTNLRKPTLAYTLDDLRHLMAVNLESAYELTRACYPLLKAASGSVVNVSSVVGRRGIPGQAGYSASKAAVSSIGEALRVEWADKGIAVTTLEPALTATGFFQAQENPRGLPDPDMGNAVAADDVAREVLELDRAPRPLRSLRWKWRILGALSVVAPRLADRALVGRLGGDWRAPER